MAWLVTLPELLAIGLAVALTPPIVSAITWHVYNSFNRIIERKYLLYLLLK